VSGGGCGDECYPDPLDPTAGGGDGTEGSQNKARINPLITYIN
jgi:hypothetical protein